MRRTLCVLLSMALLSASSTAGAQDEPPPPLDDTAPPPPPPPPPRVQPTPQPRVMVTQKAKKPKPKKVVVRAKKGNMGMFFRFGGLGTMSANGNIRFADSSNTQLGVQFMHEIGWKFVFSESLHLPISFGLGVWIYDPSDINCQGAPNNDACAAQTTWAMNFGTGLEYHFRIWRRISPFIGGLINFGFRDPYNTTATDPPPPTNLIFTLTFGPTLGVEYYIGDRVSLAAQYFFLIGIQMQNDVRTITSIKTTSEFNQPPQPPAAATSIAYSQGGALVLTFYF
jgi:hypothetical protein